MDQVLHTELSLWAVPVKMLYGGMGGTELGLRSLGYPGHHHEQTDGAMGGGTQEEGSPAQSSAAPIL